MQDRLDMQPGNLSLARVRIDQQLWEAPHEPPAALYLGSAFPSLILPFEGRKLIDRMRGGCPCA